MTALNPNNTKRYKLSYVAGLYNHHVIMRVADAVTDTEALLALTNFANAAGPGQSNDTSYTGVEMALNGSNIFNSVSGWTVIAGSGGGALPGPANVRTVTWPGRSTGGHKSRVALFGFLGSTPTAYEEDPIVSTVFADVQAQLAATPGHWLAIDGLHPVWYTRVTWNDNDHFVRRARQ